MGLVESSKNITPKDKYGSYSVDVTEQEYNDFIKYIKEYEERKTRRKQRLKKFFHIHK